MITSPLEKSTAAAAVTREPAIRVNDLTKSYKLYPNRQARIAEAFDLSRRSFHKDVHALNHVSLDIPRGATCGILGVNGSGKSTLLQIVCGIIPPTSGRIDVKGRIAALIELGSGFNPDSTGRENVSINGMIMGLTQSQVEAEMPAIEAFAEVGEFFDQPVKTYSSGMLMRVAFALAIHVDPEILVIDEALAVGDARFQQKCFRRFRDFQDAGKTILFVTHDRFSVPRLCTHGAVLHKGQLVYYGDPKEATDCYSRILINGAPEGRDSNGRKGQSVKAADGANNGTAAPSYKTAGLGRSAGSAEERDAKDVGFEARFSAFLANTDTSDRCPLNPTFNANEHRVGLGGARIVDYMLALDGEVNPTHVGAGGELAVLVRILFEEDCETPITGITITTKDGVLLFSTNSLWLGQHLSPRQAGEIATYRFDVRLDLGANDWFFDLAIARSATELLDGRETLFYLRCDPLMVGHGLASLPTRVSEPDRDA